MWASKSAPCVHWFHDLLATTVNQSMHLLATAIWSLAFCYAHIKWHALIQGGRAEELHIGIFTLKLKFQYYALWTGTRGYDTSNTNIPSILESAALPSVAAAWSETWLFSDSIRHQRSLRLHPVHTKTPCPNLPIPHT